GRSWQGIEDRFLKVIKIGLPAMIILMGVGMLIGSLIIAGTVPTILYYGFSIFSPSSFLFSVCLICAIISVATGTSWGTVGTVGLAMMGFGMGLGIPAHLTGGAIVSGAFFGDNMSPLSDTTDLSAAAAGADLGEHTSGDDGNWYGAWYTRAPNRWCYRLRCFFWRQNVTAVRYH